MSSIRAAVPLLNVADVERSILFYRKLGFEVHDSFAPDGSDKPHWASLMSGNVEIMLGSDVDRNGPSGGFALYLYSTDVAALHRDLRSAGLVVEDIRTPFYNPGGEFSMRDPDGHLIHLA